MSSNTTFGGLCDDGLGFGTVRGKIGTDKLTVVLPIIAE